MASEKTTYWVAVGVLAVGLANAWQNGDLQPVQNLADRGKRMFLGEKVEYVVECAAQRGHDLIVMSEVMLGRDPAQVPDLEAVMSPGKDRLAQSEEQAAVVERQVAEAQAKLDKMQAQLAHARVPMEKARFVFSSRVGQCQEEQWQAEMAKAQEALANLPETIQVDVRTGNYEALRNLKQLDQLQNLKHLETLRVVRPEVVIHRNYSNWAPMVHEFHIERNSGKHEEPI